jgi:hypothetical protein
MTTASVAGRHRIFVSNINVAASKTLSIKLRDLETDASGGSDVLKTPLERVREFCVTEMRKNAFLVEIVSDSNLYSDVMRLVDLRLLHVIRKELRSARPAGSILGSYWIMAFISGSGQLKALTFSIVSQEIWLIRTYANFPFFGNCCILKLRPILGHDGQGF